MRIVQGVMIFTWVDYTPSEYNDYEFPVWADALGWMMTMSSVAAIPIVACYKICTTSKEGTLLEVRSPPHVHMNDFPLTVHNQ